MQVSAIINKPAAAKAVRKVSGVGSTLVAQLAHTLHTWAIETTAYIKETKLTGQVLKVQNNNLRSSITATPVTNAGGLLIEHLQAGFGNKSIVYARIQELGGMILAKNVPFLRFKTADGRWHSRPWVYLPPRPYMRPSAEERKPLLVEQLKQAIGDYARGGN